MECYSGSVHLPDQAQQLIVWPDTKCQSSTGLCFTSLTTTTGGKVVSLGCWPPQHHSQLAWYGVPQCKNEVNRLLCLCQESLCNNSNNLPEFRQVTPEGDLLQGLLAISLLLLLLALLIITCCLFSRYRRRSPDQASVLSPKVLEAALPPPPLMRLYSAPASLSTDRVSRQPQPTLRSNLQTFIKPLLKSSNLLSQPKSAPKKRVVMEV